MPAADARARDRRVSTVSKVTMYYVTAVAIPKVNPTHPEGVDLSALPRVDMGKFFARAHAEAHLATIRNPSAFYDLRVETREEAAQ